MVSVFGNKEFMTWAIVSSVQLQLLQHYWLGHRFGLPWYWMVCLGNKQRSFCHFWDCIYILHFRLSFVDYDGYSISSKGFLPTVVDIMVRVKSLSRVQLCDTMDCSLPQSSVHGIFQARILEWVAISFSRGSSWPRDRTQVSHTVGRCFTVWATGEVRYNGHLS